MANAQQKHDYLDEHLPYMLKMLRYTHKQMQQRQHYLSWNAHFESFAVHARNLVKFLSNGDTGNFRACDFAQNFKARTPQISGLIKKLDDQVFHLGRGRPRDAIGKFGVDSAEPLAEWVESNFVEFLAKLPPEFQALFNATKADPDADGPIYKTTGSTGTGVSPAVSTSSTAQNP